MSQVFQILLKWTDGLKSGSDDFVFIKESLKKVEFTVLPTKQDKWVSLHPSFGITCWCDDKKLKKHFKHMDGIDFFYFGKLNKDEKEMFRTKVSVLMRTLGIPALSEVNISLSFLSFIPFNRLVLLLTVDIIFKCVLYISFLLYKYEATIHIFLLGIYIHLKKTWMSLEAVW